MCAKKAASTTTGKTAAAGSRKSSANGKVAPSPALPAAAPMERTLSPTDIGAVAGEIWGLLSGGNPRTLAAINKSVHAPADVVLAAVGWLAREDKLVFSSSGRTLKIGLKDDAI